MALQITRELHAPFWPFSPPKCPQGTRFAPEMPPRPSELHANGSPERPRAQARLFFSGTLVFFIHTGAGRSPGKPGKAQGGPGKARGGPRRPGKAQGGPGEPRKCLYARSGEAQGGPGKPEKAHGGPEKTRHTRPNGPRPFGSARSARQLSRSRAPCRALLVGTAGSGPNGQEP